MGANTRDKKPLRSYGIEWNVVPFSFIPNVSDSTGNPAAANTIGQVTVTRTGTGLYQVAAAGGAPRSVFVLGKYESALKGLYEIEVGTTSSTAGLFQIRCFTYGTTTLVNFAATDSVQKVSGYLFQQASSYTR